MASTLIGLQGHFKRDYQGMMQDLLSKYPLDEAVTLAVGGTGGDYEQAGRMQEAVLFEFGAKNANSIIEIACGSGRLASRLSKWFNGHYVGIDVVPELLAFANSKTSDNFTFKEIDNIQIPAPSQSADLVVGFSIFTHLLHEEIYLYFEEARRTLRPGGRLLFSFLEFGGASHMEIFHQSLGAYRSGVLAHLNMFMEKQQIEIFARELGFDVLRIVNGREKCIPIDEPVKYWNGHVEEGTCSFGQSIACLVVPK